MAFELLNPILGRKTFVEETGFSRDCWSVVRCRETGFVFLANPPDYAELASRYAWEKTCRLEHQRREASEPLIARLSLFSRHVRSVLFPKRNKVASLALRQLRTVRRYEPMKVLDIGCGWGSLMAEIYQRGHRAGLTIIPIGIEVSHKLAAISQECVQELGGQVLCANAFAATAELPTESIQLAVMSSFLEHESQPLNLLQQLHRVLTSDGAIVVKVPNYACWNRCLRGAKWCGFRYPDHVNYFTPTTLDRLASEAGFTVVRQSVLDKFPFSDNMYAVLVKRRLKRA